MRFHYDTILERPFETADPLADDTPAWLTIYLMESLKEWFGRSRGLCQCAGRLQLDYKVLNVPVLEFAQAVGPLICKLNAVWPVQVFGMADNDELMELSFSQENTFIVRQHNISGTWAETLRDICVCLELGDDVSAQCMCRLLTAVERDESAVAFGWECADFLERQKLSQLDRTFSFCYVFLDDDGERNDPKACLSALDLTQKTLLWRMFLEKGLLSPEFEWVKNALENHSVPNWIEWHLALYRTLEELNIRFFCRGHQFELIGRNGERLYFGVDHPNAAEQVLMKILFPLNQA